MVARYLLTPAHRRARGTEGSNSAGVAVYLKDDVPAAERRTVEAVLAPSDLIGAHEYVSKADALARFKQTFGDLAAAVDGVKALDVTDVAGRGKTSGPDSMLAASGTSTRHVKAIADEVGRFAKRPA